MMSEGPCTRIARSGAHQAVQVCLAAIFLVTGAQSLEAAKQRSVEQTGVIRARAVTQAQHRYLAITPTNFLDRSIRHPLIIFLHGGDQSGSDLNLLKLNGPPKYALANPDFPFVVVAPQPQPGKVWEPAAVAAMVKHAVSRFRADPNRVYLTGLSTGGYGTWKAALQYPEKFAAVVPVAGGASTEVLKHAEGEHLQALRSLPIWAFHGGSDSVVSADESQRMVAEFRDIGNSGARVTIFSGAPHDIWDRVYNDESLYNWLLTQSR